LFDSFADPLADRVTRMSRGPAIDRRAAAACEVLRYVRRDIQLAAALDETAGVEALVASESDALIARQVVVHHLQCRLALRRATRLRHLELPDASVSILHQRVLRIGALRLLAAALSPPPRLGVGRRLVRLVAR